MLDDTTAGWWYEQDGQQAGPVTAAAIGRLVAEGRLGPAHRVWREGMSGWEPLGQVAELAGVLPPPPRATPVPPPLSPPPASSPPPARPSAPPPHAPGRPPVRGFEEIPPGTTLILSAVTFGIYGLVKFHQTGRGYEALAGRASGFGRDFWLAVGLGVASGLTAHTVFLGAPLSIASLVFGVLALSEALTLRDEIVRRDGLRPQLTEGGTHKVLLVAGCVLAPLLVGLVLLLVQAWKWFSDWNAVGAALGERSGAAPAAATGDWR